MADCTVYIDEAGDLGIRRGTQWFVLTAVIIAKHDEPAIRAKIDRIKKKLNVRELHLRKITDFYKRGYIVRELDSEEFTYLNIVVDTEKLDPVKMPSAVIAYNYICKYLLQRVSVCLKDSGRTADIVLSARGTSRDGELIAYIQEKLFPYSGNHIDSRYFEKVNAKTSASWDMLQLADVCATTMFLNYEVNGYDICVPCFAKALSGHLYRKDGQIEKYGIKYFTEEMKPDQRKLAQHSICRF